MTGNLRDRPFLLLMMRVLRVMLAVCAVTMIVVGGAIYYSVTKVQGRGLDNLTPAETTGLSLLAVLLLVSVVMSVVATRILRQNT